MKFPAYPKYKPSGVEWLGDVPEKWDVKRLKYIAERSDVKIEADPEAPVPYIGLEHLESWTGKVLPLDLELVPSGIANRFKKGNVLFGKLRPYLAKACTPDFTGLCSTELLVLEASKQDSRFLRYGLLTRGFVSLVNSASYGVKMPRASWDFIGVCSLPVPTVPEQESIADFLDEQTARLDALLTRRRALIEKLQEKRSALISRTVTRGLNPKAKLKPSGVEWLGDVPQHWETKQLKWAIMFQRGHDLPSDEREEGNVPLVTSAGTTTYISKAAAKGPGIVTGRYGTIGEFYLIETDYWPLNTSLYSIELRGNHPRFLWYMLTHLSPLFLINANKSAVPGVDRNDIHPTTTAIPPLAEQVAIAEYLDRETAKIDGMVEKVEAAISKLQEYRTALITAAVTGKIDVRQT